MPRGSRLHSSASKVCSLVRRPEPSHLPLLCNGELHQRRVHDIRNRQEEAGALWCEGDAANLPKQVDLLAPARTVNLSRSTTRLWHKNDAIPCKENCNLAARLGNTRDNYLP